MKLYPTVLPVTLVIFLSIYSISYSTNHISSLRKLKESSNKLNKIEHKEEFLDLNDKETMEKIIQKIHHYESIERAPVEHLGPRNLFGEEQNLRRLSSLNSFDDVGVVDPNETDVGTLGRWIFKNTRQFEPDIIAYPYAFDYTYELNETELTNHYSQGAFITLDPATLEPYNIGLKSNSTVFVEKARALYDTDIAILSIEDNLGDYDQDLFQDSQDWCTLLQGGFAKTSCYANYDTFYSQKVKNTTLTYVTRINETSVSDGKLVSEDGFPRFGLLIIPDYKLGTDQVIKTKLGSNGINALKKYFSAGGSIIATGKSGTLLEDFGLISQGLYDRTKLFSSDTPNRQIQIKGCDETKDKTYSKSSAADYKKQLLCMGIDNNRKPALSTTFKMVKTDSGLNTLLSIDPDFGNLVLTGVEDGISGSLPEEQKSFTPLILNKVDVENNGQLYILNFNPVYGSGDKTITLNTILLALSKEMYMTTKVKMTTNSTENLDLPIPAGEIGAQLATNILFHNLNDEAISDFEMYLFLPEYFEWSSLPEGCDKRSDFDSVPARVLSKKTFNSTNDYLVCKISSVAAYEKRNFDLSIIVSDYRATQKKYSILILVPVVIYKDSEKYENLMTQYVRVNAEAASLLRVVINPDPSMFYPVHGEGDYIDNVVKVENKEFSGATEVEYVGLIPLISPLVDNEDQRVLRWNLKLYVDYYNSNNFPVPFVEDDDIDYIYTSELSGKGVYMAMEYDSPVKPVKEIRTIGDIGKEVNITGINMGAATINSTSEVIKEISYRNAERFYALASQRLLVFVDDSSPEGAKTLYNGNIPSEWLDPVNKDRAKKEFLFLRNDIYFHENENYVNPPGATENIIFSLDQFAKYEKNKSGCAKTRAKAQSQIVHKGYFSNREDSKRDKILDPNTYTNELFENCDITVVDPLSEDSIKAVFGNTDYLRPVHYIIPNVESTITEPTQIYGFVQDEDKYHGHFDKYPSLKFLYLHTINYIIDTKTCLYGGIIEINLGSNREISNVDEVTIAPDQIAIYKKEYENHVIKIYFKRGLMSNEQFGKNMTLTINIENLKSTTTETLNVKLHELKYDISYPPTYERYTEIRDEDLEFNYKSVFSYPALELKGKLNRTLNGYETIEPFSRYGVYIQELKEHRYIYSQGETHHETKPGLTGSGGGFSMISNLGISSIPFIEYLTVGAGQVIPGGTSTARVSWKDVWGRTWSQPLRSTFPDIPPGPGPLKNFMMTSTFALLRNGKIVTEWNSDEDIQIHLHVKLLNNYEKFFDITRCKENQILYVPKNGEDHTREFGSSCDANLAQSEWNGNKMFLKEGGFSSYGVCFATDGAYVQSKEVTGEFREQIERAKVCADSTDENEIKSCSEELENITTLKAASSDWDQSKIWNYSPLIESFYPKDYIEADMWQLTHIDYDDNVFSKGHPYHMDNLLPNFDNGLIKPHNVIAIPLYKGLGYDITYDKENEINYHGENKKGWWCDNLQNKDDTLLAAQETCNKISVDKKESSVKTWIDGKDLVGSKREGSTEGVQNIVDSRLKNIYVCLYNRHRPEFKPESGKYFYSANVDQNNIVPIIVDLDRNDKRLTNYQCNGTTQYTPENLRELEGNYLETLTNKDYLYFAANLRGHAKESFNIALNLKHFSEIKYEGIVKVNEGGRFVYWNPALGPNAFLVVDDPVSLVIAKRNDIDIKAELFPLTTTTFNAVVYHLYTVYDENKINQVWPFTDFYANNNGFGDASVSVYVGGIRKSKPVLEPGETTYVKIIFFNNCGFDWAMKTGAIDFEYKGSKQINDSEVLEEAVHTIKVPAKYNFLNITVEEKYEKYITVEPSDHNAEVAPEFFDFGNINVVTIRDGFKGEYALKVNVTSDFPDELRGKPIEIKLAVNPEYFDHFPGTSSDPIKSYHDYTVTVPSAYIAVPYKSGKYKGKVLYTSAQASNLDVKFNIAVDWNLDAIKYVDENIVNKMRDVLLGDEDSVNAGLKDVWDSINDTHSLNYNYSVNSDRETKVVHITGLTEDYRLFPKINYGAPDTANVSFLIKSNVSQLKYGYSYPITNIKDTFNDWTSKEKSSSTTDLSIYAKGPWLELSYTRILVDELGDGKYVVKPNQDLSQTDEGVVKVHFKLENKGNGNCYNTKYEIVVQPNLTIVGYNAGTNKITPKKNDIGQTIITFDYGTPINAGELKGGIIYLHFDKCIESFDLLTPQEIQNLPTELKVTQESLATIDLTNVTGENQVTQHLRKALTFVYTKQQMTEVYIELVVSGRRSDPNIKITPIVKHIANETDDDVVVTVKKFDSSEIEKKETRRLDDVDEADYQYVNLKENISVTISTEDKPIKNNYEKKNHKVTYSLYLCNKKTDACTSNYNSYDQAEIGLSIYEIVLIILSIISFACAALLIWFGIKNIKLAKSGNLFEKEVKNTQLDKLID